MKKITFIFIGTVLLGSVGFASASLTTTISVTATAQTTHYGYISGQDYTFNFTINPNFTQNLPFSNSGGGANSWFDTSPSNLLFSQVTGGGLSGTYAPSNPFYYISTTTKPKDPFMGVDNMNYGMEIHLGDSTGLTDSSGHAVHLISATQLVADGTMFKGDAYTDPASYFAAYAGTYTTPGTRASLIISYGGMDQEAFTPVSTTISSSGLAAVPEPTTLLSTLALVSSGLLLRRRGKCSL